MSGKVPGKALSNELQAKWSTKCPPAAGRSSAEEPANIPWLLHLAAMPSPLPRVLYLPLPTSYPSAELWLGFGNLRGRIMFLVCSDAVSQRLGSIRVLTMANSTCLDPTCSQMTR